ncbi:MAG: hypothetical protein ACRD08_18130, partial [Acidimicrobiales bacterium]
MLVLVGMLASCAEPTDQGGIQRVAIPPASIVATGYQLVNLGGLAPREVNNAGQVLGTVFVPPDQAAVWANGSTTFLGALGGSYSRPSDMNELGHVVGEMGDDGNVHRLPFFWRSPRGPMIRVPLPPPFTDGYATAISDHGTYV